jgi:serine/threonine protein phosphatase 1
MEDTSTYLETDSYLFVHAGLDFNHEQPLTDEHSMLWIRNFDPRPDKIDGRILIHGHIPLHLDDIYVMRDKPMQFGHIGLDNGVYMAGRPGYGNLVAMELNSMEIYSQYNIDM